MMNDARSKDLKIIDLQDVQQRQQEIQPKLNTRPTQLHINSLSSYKQSRIHQQTQKSQYNKYQHQINKDSTISDMLSQPSMDQSQIVFCTNQKHKQISKDKYGQEYVEFEEDDNSPQKFKRKNNTISLMRPSQNIYQKVYAKLDKTYVSLIKNPFSFPTLHKFLHEQLPSLSDTNFMRYIFQIHSYNFQFTFHSYYEFYIRNSQGEMVNIMRAQKDSLTVSSSYQMLAVNPNDLKNKQFTAKLKYNTLKSEYNLYDIDEKVHSNSPRNILATVFYDKAFGQSRQMKMYRPKEQYRVKGQFVKSPNFKNLSQYYDETQTALSRKVQKLNTVEIQKGNEESVREQFQLKKQGRKILLRNQEGLQKFYMGKKQDGRYIILAGSELSPLQIFMLAVINLQH